MFPLTQTSLPSRRSARAVAPARKHVGCTARKRAFRYPAVFVGNDYLTTLQSVHPCFKEHEAMQTKTVKIPGPDHPITIEPNPARITIAIGDRVIADTREALTLREASYPAVQYIPRKDVDMSLLERTGHATCCPYKGECAYYSIPIGGARSANAVWTYEEPFAAVVEIKDHLAFFPDRVDAIG